MQEAVRRGLVRQPQAPSPEAAQPPGDKSALMQEAVRRGLVRPQAPAPVQPQQPVNPYPQGVRPVGMPSEGYVHAQEHGADPARELEAQHAQAAAEARSRGTGFVDATIDIAASALPEAVSRVERGWKDVGRAMFLGEGDLMAAATGNMPPDWAGTDNQINSAMGITPESRDALGHQAGVSSQDHGVAAFTAGLATMPIDLAEPTAIAAMILARQPTAGIMDAVASTGMLQAVSSRFGPKIAQAVQGQLSGAVGGGAFGGIHANITGATQEAALHETGMGAALGSAFHAPSTVGNLAGAGMDALAARGAARIDARGHVIGEATRAMDPRMAQQVVPPRPAAEPAPAQPPADFVAPEGAAGKPAETAYKRFRDPNDFAGRAEIEAKAAAEAAQGAADAGEGVPGIMQGSKVAPPPRANGQIVRGSNGEPIMVEPDVRLKAQFEAEQGARDAGEGVPGIMQGTKVKAAEPGGRVVYGKNGEAIMREAEPAVAKRQAIPREEILKQAVADHPETAAVVESMMSMEKGDFVLADVPIEKLTIDVPSGDAAAEGISRAKFEKYASMPAESAPPGIAVRVGGKGDELFVADARHRTIAARLRGDKSAKMYVPKEWADAHLPEAEGAKPPTKRTQLADAKYNQSKAVLDKTPDIGPRELSRQAKIPYTTAQRHVTRFKAEPKKTAEPPLEVRAQPPQQPAGPTSPPEKPAKWKDRQALKAQPPVTEAEPGPTTASQGVEPTKPPAGKQEAETFMRRWERVSEFEPEEQRALLAESSEETIQAVREHLKGQRGADPRLVELLGDDTADPGPSVNLEAELRSRGGTTPEAQRKLGDWVETLADHDLEHLKSKAKGSSLRIVEDEIQRRAEPPDEAGADVGSPRRPRPNTSPETAGSPIRLRSILKSQGRATTAPHSPHEIIARISQDLGLSWPGVGGARKLKKWAAGFYRVNPEAIRLRMADDLDTHIHEIGHHLQKLFFQGGETAMELTPGGKQASRTGMRHGVFPKAWHQELMTLGRRLYGARKPAAGYEAEGWAELIRHAFTDDVGTQIDINGKMTAIKDLQAYKDTMAMLARDWPEQYAALDRFRKSYTTYRDGSPVAKLAGYIRRGTTRDPQTWAWYNRLRTALTDRFHALAVMKKDVGLDVRADKDPHTVALRAFGRSTGDLKIAMRYGRFDPMNPSKLIGPSLEQVLRPVAKDMPEFESYLIARRALEKRSQGNKGIFPNLSNADLREAVRELDKTFPKFYNASQDFQEFNQWLIRDYAVQHGLITPAVADAIIKKNLEYATFRRVLNPVQGRPGSTSGGPNRYSDTGTGVRRFPKDLQGHQIDPPIEAFMMSMQGIMSRAEMNRVGQTIVRHFERAADFGTMPRWRLESVAEERGIDPALPRPAIIAELGKMGVRVSEVEGMGRWIDAIDRPLEAIKMSGADVHTKLAKLLEAQGVAPDDPLIEGLRQLLEGEDFLAFKPGFKTDKKTRQFSVLQNGKPTFWEAKNEGLFRVLEGFENPAAVHGFMRILAMPRAIYRAGATALNPDFAIANWVKDTFQALVMTGVTKGGGAAGAKGRLKGRLEGVFKAFLTGDPGQMFLASGADMSGLFGEYIDPRTKEFKVDKLFVDPNSLVIGRHGALPIVQGKTWKAKALDVASTAPVWRAVERFNQRLELATRLGEFNAKLNEGDVLRAKDLYGKTDPASVERAKGVRSRADIEEAGQAAADVSLDFTRGGTAAMEINKYIPFFNAAFLGGDKLARYIRSNPYRAFGRIFTYVIAPSIASHLLNRDDEEYWNIPYNDRDRYWYFGMGDPDGDDRKEYLRVPKPYGLGAFALATERMLARYDGLDPATGKRGDPKALEGMMGAMAREFRPPYYVPVLLPSLELYMNRSIWQDSDIVRRGEQVGPAGERGAERSSELARALGGLMEVPPPQIDYAIQGFLAGMGTNVVQYGVDPLIKIYREDLMGYEPLVTKKARNTQLEGFPIIKRLIAEEPKTYSETLIRFWDTFNEAESAFRGWSSRQDRKEDYSAYYQQHKALIEAYKNVLPYKNDINELFKDYRRVLNDRTLSDTERRSKENKILDEIQKAARQGLADVDRFKPKKENPK